MAVVSGRDDSPCGSCPWRLRNQTKAAVEASPIDGSGRHWYDRRNLRRHWVAVADGKLLPCHATDRNAPLYGGKSPSAKAKPRVCVGISILARREVTAFMEAGTDHARYKQAGGSMTLRGLASWAARLIYGGASLVIGRESLRLPQVTHDDSEVGLAWRHKT